MQEIIAQGAEAILIKKDNLLIKKRIKKGYRQPELDKKLRFGRTRRESKLLEKTSSIINVPIVRKVSESEIVMDFIEGKLLSNFLDTIQLDDSKKICEQIGKEIAILHSNNIIHGDLTTSNMLFFKDKVYFIDFGLGFVSVKIEDKAVDLHLLKQAFESKHFVRYEHYLEAVLHGYSSYDKKQATLVLKQLEQVEARGRYKSKTKGKKL